jgi:cell wall-associated NlpC family hydrolase
MARRGLLRALCVAALIATAFGALADAAGARGYGKRTLKTGTHGRDVKLFQRYLTRAGLRVRADGAYGRRTARAMRRFERRAHRRVDGKASRRDQRVVQRVARHRPSEGATTGGTKLEPPQGNPAEQAVLAADGRTAIAPDSAPQEVKDAIAAANRITDKPYRYGGGHGDFEDSGYDCSGAVSYAMHGGGLLDRPLDSTGFESWGSRGRGDWITVYANSGHAYAVIAGLRFDTSSGGHGERGPRWRSEARSSRGFVARHPAGL